MAHLSLIFVDMEELKQFAKDQGAPEANDLNLWDTAFWSERLRESKYDINEVNLSPTCPTFMLQF